MKKVLAVFVAVLCIIGGANSALAAGSLAGQVSSALSSGDLPALAALNGTGSSAAEVDAAIAALLDGVQSNLSGNQALSEAAAAAADNLSKGGISPDAAKGIAEKLLAIAEAIKNGGLYTKDNQLVKSIIQHIANMAQLPAILEVMPRLFIDISSMFPGAVGGTEDPLLAELPGLGPSYPGPLGSSASEE